MGSLTKRRANFPRCCFGLLGFVLMLFGLSWTSSWYGYKHGHADSCAGVVEEASFDFCQGAATYYCGTAAKLV